MAKYKSLIAIEADNVRIERKRFQFILCLYLSCEVREKKRF